MKHKQPFLPDVRNTIQTPAQSLLFRNVNNLLTVCVGLLIAGCTQAAWETDRCRSLRATLVELHPERASYYQNLNESELRGCLNAELLKRGRLHQLQVSPP